MRADLPAHSPLVSAIILAGGNATRMNGANKGLVKLYNTPLIRFVLEKINPQVDELLISANRDLATFAVFGHPILADVIKAENGDLIGPLAGLHAGLSNARHDYVFCSPCDMPNLPLTLVSRLMAQLQLANAEIAVVKTNDDVIPVLCLCRKSVLSSLTAYINQGGRRVSTWQKSCAYIEADLSDTFTYNAKGEVADQGGDFSNLNTMQDIENYE